MNKQLVGALVLLLGLSGLPGCATPLTYSAKDIHGQIVDDETGEPIEGAIVVAQWVLFRAGIGHGGHDGRLHIYETVTDEQGRYYIPGWGPKLHPPMTALANRDPEILIFKSGYEPKRLQNADIDNNKSVRVSDWNGKVVKLEKSSDGIERQGRLLGSFFTSLGYRASDPNWRKYPRMLLAVSKEKSRLRALGLAAGRASSIPEIEYFSASDRDYLRRFEK